MAAAASTHELQAAANALPDSYSPFLPPTLHLAPHPLRLACMAPISCPHRSRASAVTPLREREPSTASTPPALFLAHPSSSSPPPSPQRSPPSPGPNHCRQCRSPVAVVAESMRATSVRTPRRCGRGPIEGVRREGVGYGSRSSTIESWGLYGRLDEGADGGRKGRRDNDGSRAGQGPRTVHFQPCDWAS